MYLRKVHIENIRSIAELDWEIPEGSEAGWHVVIGDNGAGKTTFLRAIALALVGEDEARSLQPNWLYWLRRGSRKGLVTLELVGDPRFDGMTFRLDWQTEEATISSSKDGYTITEKGRLSAPDPEQRAFEQAEELRREGLPFSIGLEFQGIKLSAQNGKPAQTERDREKTNNEANQSLPNHVHLVAQNDDVAKHLVWGGIESGWFSASYGPFRRFSGGSRQDDERFSTSFRLAAHLSLFDEKYALTECLSWLQTLHHNKTEGLPEGEWLDRIRAFINQEGFLPHQARLEKVSSKGVFFIDADGHELSVENFSDGYRSILSLTFELIRQLTFAYDPHNLSTPNRIFDETNSKIIAPGVVLIDEVDAHLHPTWQRSIGQWFRKHFPYIQFIVTTHSPLVCQAAEVGTVFRLPEPGSEEQAGMVTGTALNRLRYGDVIEAYGTQLFGEDVGRSEAGLKKLERLAALNIKELNKGLTKNEMKEQEELRAAMPTAPHRLP